MTRQARQMLLVAAAILTVALWAPGAGHAQTSTQVTPLPAPPPAGDPRAAQIRAALELRGVPVLGVELIPAQGSSPRIWSATTKATYIRADAVRLETQAKTIWEVMFTILAQEEPGTFLSGTQIWHKYAIIARVRMVDIMAFDAAINKINPRDTGAYERIVKAEQEFLKKVQTFVYDIEQQQFVDFKDFINKHVILIKEASSMFLAIRLAQQLPVGLPSMGGPDYGRVLTNMLFLLAWVIVSAIAFAIAVPIAMRVFNRMTPGIDEMTELKNGNTAVAIVMGATILAMVLLVMAVVLK